MSENIYGYVYLKPILSIFDLKVINKSSHDWNNVSTFVFFKFHFACQFLYNFLYTKLISIVIENNPYPLHKSLLFHERF